MSQHIHIFTQPISSPIEYGSDNQPTFFNELNSATRRGVACFVLGRVNCHHFLHCLGANDLMEVLHGFEADTVPRHQLTSVCNNTSASQ